MVIAGGQTASGPSNDLKVSPFTSLRKLDCIVIGLVGLISLQM